MLHDGDVIKKGKNFVGPSQTYSYPIKFRYKSDWTWSDAVKWFSAGVLTGGVLVSPASGILAMEVATTGTFTYNATTLVGGTTVMLKILSGSKALSKVPALNNLALKSIEVNRPITGIIRSDGTIEAHVQNTGYTISHKSLGLTKADTGFNMSFYDGQWYVTGSGYASGQGWNMPSTAQ